MKLIFILTLFQLPLCSFGQTVIALDSSLDAKRKETYGKPFPGFIAKNEEGQITNDSLLGKVVVINFWFEGCHPCLAEFGAFNELVQKLKDNKDFAFVSFTWDNPETTKRVKEKYHLQFKVFWAGTDECRRLNQNNGYPTTIILDRRGNIKDLVSGGSTDPEKAREFIMTNLLPKIEREL